MFVLILSMVFRLPVLNNKLCLDKGVLLLKHLYSDSRMQGWRCTCMEVWNWLPNALITIQDPSREYM